MRVETELAWHDEILEARPKIYNLAAPEHGARKSGPNRSTRRPARSAANRKSGR
jgi:hypothetical protein